MNTPSAELLSRINSLNIRLYGLTSGKIIIGEVLETFENGVELNYALTVSQSDGNIRFAPAAHGETVATPAIIYSNHVEFESIATLRLKKYYLDYLTVSKVSGYTNEDINEPTNIHQPLDPKGYVEDYWQKIAGRLLP
jgi:hypothetical protein